MFKKNSLCANLFYFVLYSDTAAAVFVPMQLFSVIVALYSNCHYCSVPMQHCCVIAALSSAQIVHLYEGILAIYVVGSLWHIVIVNKLFRQCHCKWHCVKHSQHAKHGSLCVCHPENFYKIGALKYIAFCANFDLLADKLNIKRIQRTHYIKFFFTIIAQCYPS